MLMRILFAISSLSFCASSTAQTNSRTLGNKSYEVSNHLGNVMVVVSDRKTPISETTNTTIDYNETDIKSFNDYYPYGMVLENRSLSKAEAHRFGFQGQEKDDEVKGKNNSVNYKYRVHDPRLGRFFAVDPLSEKYPHYSSYQFSGNKTINSIELEGLEEINASANFSFFLKGGFSASLAVGIQDVSYNTMTAFNASITYKRGGPGTSMLSKNLVTLSMSPSVTIGAGQGEELNLNIFTSNSASAITNNFYSSFTLGGSLVISASKHTGLDNIFQWLGGAAVRYSGFQVASYNDTFRFPFFGSDKDQFNSAGLNAQVISSGSLLKFYFDLYYGASDENASYDEDRIFNGTNYDNQSFYDMLLNNGNMSTSFSDSKLGVLSSGYEVGYSTFVMTSNAMHNTIKSYSLFGLGDYHFHHLFVPYDMNGYLSGERMLEFITGYVRWLSKTDNEILDNNDKTKKDAYEEN